MNSNFDKLVKSQKSHIFIISGEIRIPLLQIVISVSSVANCIFYEFIKLEIGENRRMPGWLIKYLRRQNEIHHFEGVPGPSLPV